VSRVIARDAPNGKEGVGGSSPPEGFRKVPANTASFVCGPDDGRATRRPPNVHRSAQLRRFEAQKRSS
jgi:hypothetical protein